jgi:four helix bundle protein
MLDCGLAYGTILHMQDFRKIRVWHLATDFAVSVPLILTVRACRGMPGIRNQIIRASTSVPANIAEGCAKPNRELRRYLEVSLGSVHEIETHLKIAAGTAIISRRDHQQLQSKLDTIRKMLIKFILKLEESAEETE